MRGITLFGDRLATSPLRAMANLAGDYGVYVGMCAFSAVLLISRRPLAWLADRYDLELRDWLIERAMKLPGA